MVQQTIRTASSKDERSSEEKKRLTRERDEARESAESVGKERDRESTRAGKLERRLAATAQIIVAGATALAGAAYFSISAATVVVVAAVYLAAVVPLEVLGWGGKRDHPWWGRVTAFSACSLTLASMFTQFTTSVRAAFGSAALATFLVFIREVAPKRKA
jgi:hypothetical protein